MSSIYKSASGASFEHEQLKTAIKNLQDVAQQIDDPSPVHNNAALKPLSNCARKCQEICKKFIEFLDSLLAKDDSKWAAFRATVKILRKSHEKQQLVEDLDMCRKMLNSAVLSDYR